MASAESTPPAEASEDPANALHHAAIVVDAHTDVTQRLLVEGADLRERQPDGQVDIPRMREGGLDAAFLSVWAPPMLFRGDRAHAYATEQLDAIDRLVATSKHSTLATRASEVRAAVEQGQTVFLIGIEGGHMLGDASDDELLERLKGFRERGARYMTLTWSNSNRIGGSSGDDGASRGLTPFGKRVVQAMNTLGVIVDVSHVSDPTFMDVMKATTRPVLASHSSARALSPHPRNMTDDMLRAVRDNGGAVCVNFGPMFLDEEWNRAYAPRQGAAIRELMASMAGQGPPDAMALMRAAEGKFHEIALALPDVPAKLVVDHVEHVARVAGVDHTCFGSDFDGVPKGPTGLEDASKLPFITTELLRRGFTEVDVRKILGENVLRVMAANEP